MGCKEWQDKIPRAKQPLHLIVFLLNIFPSCWGTFLVACINEAGQFEQCTLIIGVVQWLLVWGGYLLFWWIFFIPTWIGWFWSIWWGWLIFQKGK